MLGGHWNTLVEAAVFEADINNLRSETPRSHFRTYVESNLYNQRSQYKHTLEHAAIGSSSKHISDFNVPIYLAASNPILHKPSMIPYPHPIHIRNKLPVVLS